MRLLKQIFIVLKPKKFDVVVIDAPVLQLVQLERNKEIQYLFPEKRLNNLIQIQKDLNVAKKFVKDNGVILYCIVLFFSEGENQILILLKK